MIFIRMQIKLILTTEVVHLASFWKREFLELENGLLELLDALTIIETTFSKI